MARRRRSPMLAEPSGRARRRHQEIDMHPTLAQYLVDATMAERERTARPARSFTTTRASRVRNRHVDEHGGFRTNVRLAVMALRGHLVATPDGIVRVRRAAGLDAR